MTCLEDIILTLYYTTWTYNPLPDMPILGSFNSAADEDMMSEIWINRDTIT